MKKRLVYIKNATLNYLCNAIALWVVPVFYGNIWNLRKKSQKSNRSRLYYAYLRRFGSWIALEAEIEEPLITPHHFHGVFISTNAKIGKGVVVMQQVTIGSNTTKGSKRNGSPIIEDNVFIGAGAKIIGNVRVGHNSRVGANCVVVKDVPPNSVVVLKDIEIITKTELMDNTWIPAAHQE